MYSSYFLRISYDSVVIIFQVLMLVQATLSAQYSIFPKGVPPLCVCVCVFILTSKRSYTTTSQNLEFLDFAILGEVSCFSQQSPCF